MDRKKQILNIADKYGVFKTKDIESAGIPRTYLYMLCKEGRLEKVGRGLFRSNNMTITENIDLIEVSKQVPRAVICLISALSFHQITTQIPHQVWISIPKGSWSPSIEYPPLSITFVSETPYSFGIEEHQMNGASVKIYSPAKTVADCFKFRNKVGLDVALEALREVWRSKKATVNELMEAAAVCRVAKIMRPYLEAIV